jgi:hypothetical protein
MRALQVLSIVLSSVSFASTAGAHSGGLNADGCHNDRKNGGYHCHRSGGVPIPQQAARPPRGLSSQQDGVGSPALAPIAGAFANCTAARAAGAAPVRRGDPGYAPRLDRDGDGIGCE